MFASISPKFVLLGEYDEDREPASPVAHCQRISLPPSIIEREGKKYTASIGRGFLQIQSIFSGLPLSSNRLSPLPVCWPHAPLSFDGELLPRTRGERLLPAIGLPSPPLIDRLDVRRLRLQEEGGLQTCLDHPLLASYLRAITSNEEKRLLWIDSSHALPSHWCPGNREFSDQ